MMKLSISLGARAARTRSLPASTGSCSATAAPPNRSQYANELMSRAYQGKWHDENGEIADQANPTTGNWFVADTDPSDGLPIVQFDPAMEKINPQANCSSANDNTGCTCDGNRSCAVLDKYKSVIWFMSRMDTWIKVGAKGLYPEHDLFIQLMKLKNTLRYIRGEPLITHLGREYYD